MFLRLLNTAIQILPSLLLRNILSAIETSEVRKGVRYSLFLFGTLSSKCVIENLYFTTVVNQGLNLRSQLTSNLYNRTLQSSTSSTAPPLSLLTTDIPTLESTYTQIHTLWDAPLQCCIYIYLLHRLLHNHVRNGLLILLLTVPLSTYFVSRSSSIRRKTLPHKDSRLRHTQSYLSSTTTSKLLRSSNSILSRAEKSRKKEVQGHLQSGLYKSLNSSVLGSTSSLILALTLISLLRSSSIIKASDIFTAVSLFNQLRFPLLFYPMLMNSFSEGYISLKRLSNALDVGDAVGEDFRRIKKEEGGCWVKNVTSYHKGTHEKALENVTVENIKGGIVAVIGDVGVGKTSLCNLLVGEVSSSYIQSGTVDYYNQETWLSYGTVKEAVTFGRPVDDELFNECIQVSGLLQDFNTGIMSPSTQVGTSGSNLSGGQRARVSLARTLYGNRDKIVIDDPFASLDYTVGRQIFKNLKEWIKKNGKSCVMVVNDLAIAEQCDVVSNYFQITLQSLVASYTSEKIQAAVFINRLVLYTVIVGASQFFRSALTLLVGVRSGGWFFENMMKGIIKGKEGIMGRVGEVGTRFSQELNIIDTSLPDQFGWVVTCFLQIVFSSAAIATALSPLTLFPLSILGYIYMRLTGFFRSGARNLKTLESATKGPINSLFLESELGGSVVRSTGTADVWIDKFKTKLDDNLRTFHTIKRCDRYLSVRLETLANTLTLVAAAISCVKKTTGGNAGWGLSQALSITGLLNWAVRCLTETEQMIVSTVRVNEIINVPSELDKEVVSSSDERLLKSGWPWNGEVKFEGVSAKYGENEPDVLKSISLTFPAGKSTAIIGRTGSGKSSVLLSLFRLMPTTGLITLSGVDVKSVKLDNLRKQISVIPQDGHIYPASLRDNLDVSGDANDDICQRALNVASPELALRYPDLSLKLDPEDLSSGEKSLISLARALVSSEVYGTRILVLDEATAKLDEVSDARIQKVIKERFRDKGCTVIAVAHRMDTIRDYDHVVELKDGVVEKVRDLK
ncbi:hypothetical protein TrVE_jg12120 [Triparma verrucosa]|uniref:Uncharacterized protein n=1 Tax=Triparma verrucosa TaxID=1606542 RepID=A0A9W7C7S6_9STRA|nr:hypothetical protein TrVE_jg12120 [Triparma verrucosa]